MAVNNTVKHCDYHYNERYIIATELKIITGILQLNYFTIILLFYIYFALLNDDVTKCPLCRRRQEDQSFQFLKTRNFTKWRTWQKD